MNTKNNQVVVSYFVPDNRKSGGKYITATVNIINVDEINNALVTLHGIKVDVYNILNIA